MVIKMIKYRLECFNKDGSFHHFSIEDTIEDATREQLKWMRKMNDLKDNYRVTKLYKCNEKGNNYSHRQIY